MLLKLFWQYSKQNLFKKTQVLYNQLKITLFSLFYNDFMDIYYIGDSCMEPLFWMVDHFTKILGPVCVVAVILLTLSIIVIAYVIGLPFYMRQSFYILSLALILGHWILINVLFYYYMSFVTIPGHPPQGAMVAEAVSICKKCIAPKPQRTHHCTVCNRCILKMDHHCPWLNNCIGHFNHRYFFMFCVYAWIGVLFLIMFGIPIAYDHFLVHSENDTFSPKVIQFFNNCMFLVKNSCLLQEQNSFSQNATIITNNASITMETLYHSFIVYAALLCVGVFFIVGGLITWHARLISKGETSIEGHINKSESARFKQEGKMYKNPYDLGLSKNWKVFLCIGFQRPWWNLLYPFVESPIGDGIQWNILMVIEDTMFKDQKHGKSKICLV